MTGPLHTLGAAIGRAAAGALNAEMTERMTQYERFAAPGHFYSPVPSLEEVARDGDRLFAAPPAELPDIDLNVGGQLATLEALAAFYPEMPFPDRPDPRCRFYFENEFFSYGDAIALYGMIRHCRPRRIVEIGSGWSSAATLDTNEKFFGGRIDCVFVEPYPHNLRMLARGLDAVQVHEARLQDVSLDPFRQLAANDILFVDSTHVSKVGSDVNRVFFDILPLLADGVVIHFHDIFYPFEYPRAWIEEGRAWNEAYLLRAFLQHNRDYEIVLFNNYLGQFHAAALQRLMPRWLGNCGGSIWLRKRAGR